MPKSLRLSIAITGRHHEHRAGKGRLESSLSGLLPHPPLPVASTARPQRGRARIVELHTFSIQVTE